MVLHTYFNLNQKHLYCDGVGECGKIPVYLEKC